MPACTPSPVSSNAQGRPEARTAPDGWVLGIRPGPGLCFRHGSALEVKMTAVAVGHAEPQVEAQRELARRRADVVPPELRDEEAVARPDGELRARRRGEPGEAREVGRVLHDRRVDFGLAVARGQEPPGSEVAVEEGR